jgi:hypothetical protein
MLTRQTIAAVALVYHQRGWKPVPVDRKSKKAIGTGWQKRPFDPAQFNGNALNIAVQFGAVSGGLNDVDLDCTEALGFALEFLPATGAIFGRNSKPCSHMLYITELHKTEKLSRIAFREYQKWPRRADDRRAAHGHGYEGALTMFPPSMHVTGEMVEWVKDGEPARVGGADLKRAVMQLAIACLLKRHYPGEGSGHEGALVIGGVLARAGWNADDIKHLMQVVARAAGDDEVHDRGEAAASAVNAKANGKDVPGLTRLAEVWGKDAADTLGHWLGVLTLRKAKGSGLEDSIALAFAEQNADDYRYIAASSQWMRWSTSRWKPEQTLAAFDEARRLCRQAGDAQAKTVAAVERLAKSDRRIAATSEHWDTEAKLINTPTTENT